MRPGEDFVAGRRSAGDSATGNFRNPWAAKEVFGRFQVFQCFMKSAEAKRTRFAGSCALQRPEILGFSTPSGGMKRQENPNIFLAVLGYFNGLTLWRQFESRICRRARETDRESARRCTQTPSPAFLSRGQNVKQQSPAWAELRSRAGQTLEDYGWCFLKSQRIITPRSLGLNSGLGGELRLFSDHDWLSIARSGCPARRGDSRPAGRQGEINAA